MTTAERRGLREPGANKGPIIKPAAEGRGRSKASFFSTFGPYISPSTALGRPTPPPPSVSCHPRVVWESDASSHCRASMHKIPHPRDHGGSVPLPPPLAFAMSRPVCTHICMDRMHAPAGPLPLALTPLPLPLRPGPSAILPPLYSYPPWRHAARDPLVTLVAADH